MAADKRIKMDCPFCHTPAHQIQLSGQAVKRPGGSTFQGVIRCPTCGCSFSGEGKQNLIDKWNRR